MRKILFVIESLHCGGAEKSLVTLLQNFDFHQNQVELLLLKKGGEFEEYIPNQVKVRYITSLNSIYPIRLFFLKFKLKISLFRDTKKKFHSAQQFWKTFGNEIPCVNDKFDIAIAYNQGFSTYFVAEKVKAKIKYAWLNTDYQKAGYQPDFDFLRYCFFDKVVAVSDENSLSISQAMAKIEKSLPLTVIKDITDIDVVREMALNEEGLPNLDGCVSILSVGRLAKEKAFNLAIDAAIILKGKKIKFKWYVIGEGSERFLLEKLIKKNLLEESFVLLGFKKNPYPYIKSCDIYVQTSAFEGLGLTIIEALALGKPVISTNFPTSYSIIKNNITGLICQMNGLSIASNISRYIDDADFKNFIVKNLKSISNESKNKSLTKIKDLIREG